jgi:hypothetical protein
MRSWGGEIPPDPLLSRAKRKKRKPKKRPRGGSVKGKPKGAAKPFTYEQAEKVFWRDKVNIGGTSECWFPKVIGPITLMGRKKTAAVWAYYFSKGRAIPGGATVRHRFVVCTSKRCCNPAHLYMTTPPKKKGGSSE